MYTSVLSWKANRQTLKLTHKNEISIKKLTVIGGTILISKLKIVNHETIFFSTSAFEPLDSSSDPKLRSNIKNDFVNKKILYRNILITVLNRTCICLVRPVRNDRCYRISFQLQRLFKHVNKIITCFFLDMFNIKFIHYSIYIS